MWLPDWLYRRLPLIYLIAGLLCLWQLRLHPVVGLSALALLGAAGYTFVMRRSARDEAERQAERKRRHQRMARARISLQRQQAE